MDPKATSPARSVPPRQRTPTPKAMAPAVPFFLPLLLVAPAALLLLLLALAFLVRPRPVRVPIRGRHVFITGGSSGIGLALAKRAAVEGARVSILARSLRKLEEARDEIHRATGVEVAVYSADVRDEAAVRKAVDDAGPVDVLVCNHGVFVPQEMEAQSMEDIRFMVDVNLMGTFHLVKAALPGMKRGGGGPRSIAFMSSQAGQSRRRPEVTNKIAGSSVGMKAEDVAKKALNGIKSGSFIVPCNFDGLMLSIATAGLSPQRSYLMALVEVVGGGLLRFVALCFQWGWYCTIEKCRPVKQKIRD
ncbi:hypothetical protein Taro_008072 [Colocasia esculenta]|uniref:Ketoreductase domain-containing protein n=1 Tax=Colocasia esculenta TaxID=4460 RepID=A0A843U0V7_COLES|nr:hypothetical protein [Colocasia esculenta]